MAIYFTDSAVYAIPMKRLVRKLNVESAASARGVPYFKRV